MDERGTTITTIVSLLLLPLCPPYPYPYPPSPDEEWELTEELFLTKVPPPEEMRGACRAAAGRLLDLVVAGLKDDDDEEEEGDGQEKEEEEVVVLWLLLVVEVVEVEVWSSMDLDLSTPSSLRHKLAILLGTCFRPLHAAPPPFSVAVFLPAGPWAWAGWARPRLLGVEGREPSLPLRRLALLSDFRMASPLAPGGDAPPAGFLAGPVGAVPLLSEPPLLVFVRLDPLPVLRRLEALPDLLRLVLAGRLLLGVAAVVVVDAALEPDAAAPAPPVEAWLFPPPPAPLGDDPA